MLISFFSLKIDFLPILWYNYGTFLKGVLEMKKEILYRVFRIIFVIVFVMFFSMIRNNVKASYEDANKIINNMPGFTVTQVDNNIDKSCGLREEHSVEIKNVIHKKQDVSFVLNNTNDAFPYNYMNYTIMKDNKVVKEGIIKEEGTLYKATIDKNENSIYKIILTMSQDDIIALGGISTYAEFTFI